MFVCARMSVSVCACVSIQTTWPVLRPSCVECKSWARAYWALIDGMPAETQWSTKRDRPPSTTIFSCHTPTGATATFPTPNEAVPREYVVSTSLDV